MGFIEQEPSFLAASAADRYTGLASFVGRDF